MSYIDDSELDAIRRLLREISEIAEQATLTGSLHTGAARVAERYNAIVARLKERGRIEEGHFSTLPTENVDFGAIGVESRMLYAYLFENGDKRRHKRKDFDENEMDEAGEINFGAIVAIAPFADPADLAQLVREKIEQGGRLPSGLLPALAPFLDRAFLGEIIRSRPKAPVPPQPPQPPTPEPSEQTRRIETPATQPAPPQPQIRLDQSQDEMQQLIARLQQPEISQEERRQIGLRIAQLSSQ